MVNAFETSRFTIRSWNRLSVRIVLTTADSQKEVVPKFVEVKRWSPA